MDVPSSLAPEAHQWVPLCLDLPIQDIIHMRLDSCHTMRYKEMEEIRSSLLFSFHVADLTHCYPQVRCLAQHMVAQNNMLVLS